MRWTRFAMLCAGNRLKSRLNKKFTNGIAYIISENLLTLQKMGKKHNYVSLAPKMNFFQRLIWKFRYNHTPQVQIAHKSGFTWQVFTRVNSKGTWIYRETLKNKKAAQAM